jgi:hypothetical protein
MTAISVVYFPRDLLYLIADFLLAQQEQNKLVFRFSRDWRNFMNTSKQYFGEWKRKSQVVVLRTLYADMFLTYLKFRERILESMENSIEQLAVHFYNRVRAVQRVVDLANVKGLKALVLSNCEISNFPYVSEEISLSSCRFIRLNDRPPSRRFTTWGHGFFNILSVVDWMKSIEEVSVSNVNHNYSALAQLKGSISISDSPEVVDVSCFKHVKVLKFYSCYNITDVSSLGNVYELGLSGCSGIRDISALGKVYSLDLSNNGNITDVSALGNVHTLNMNYCSGVIDVSALKNVQELSFTGFHGNDISGLENVEKLMLGGLVTNITMLKSVKELNISSCYNIKDFHGLKNLKKLSIAGMDPQRPFLLTAGEEVFENLVDLETYSIHLHKSKRHALLFSHLTHLRSWYLSSCRFSEFSSSLVRLRKLDFLHCECPSLFLELPFLEELSISNGVKMSKVEISGKNGCHSPLCSVTVSDCEFLTEIVITRRISTLKILRCKKLCDLTVDCQCQINHLRTEACSNLQISSFAPIVYYVDDNQSDRDDFVRRYQDDGMISK